MHSFFVFTEKELIEQIRTVKGIALCAVALIFGMISPLTAKLTPEIMKLAMSGEASGIRLQIPTPTFADSYTQFFKNTGSMAIIVIILLFAGGIVSEVSKGTAQLMLTRNLSRTSFILSKFVCYSIVWTISYAASAAVCLCYTVYLFPDGKPAHLFFALLCMWLYGILITSAVILASAVFSGYAWAAIGSLCIWALLGLLSSIPKIQKYVPSALAGENMELIKNSLSPADLRIPLISGFLLAGLFILAACLLFRRREI